MMMAQHAITIPRAGDAALVVTFRELAAAYGATHTSFRILGGEGSLEEPRDSSILGALVEKNSAVIYQAQAHFPGLNIEFIRGGSDKSGVFDEIRLNVANPQDGKKLDNAKRIALVSTLSRKLGALEPDRIIGGEASQAQAQLAALHHSILERLEQTATTQLQKNSDYLRKLEADHAKRRKELESSFDHRQAELDKRLDDNRRELEARTKALDERERELDNRTHTHARRAIRGDLKQELQKREQEFRLTKGTRQMRLPVHILCTGLLAGLGSLLGYTSWETLNLMKVWSAQSTPAHLQPEFYYVILRQVVLAMAVGGSTIFYVRWLNRWQQEHAGAEFELKRFQLDVDRASWVVETAFEWQSQVKEPLPPELLTAMTRNLFDARLNKDDDVLVHPADELASALMGTASKIKLHAGPAEIEIDGKRLRGSRPIQGEPAKAPNGHA